MTGWPLFALLVVMGFVDLGFGILFSRRRDAMVGEKPAEIDPAAAQSRRITGYAMMGSALLLWAMAAAFATGLLGAGFALPMFAGAFTS